MLFSGNYKKEDLTKYDISPVYHYTDSNIAVLVLHGLSASAQQMIYINQALIKKNYTVVCPNLKGHAENLKELDKIKLSDWLNQVDECYCNLKEQYTNVYIVGLSLGGSLALYLGTKYNQISGIIAINLALKYYGLSSTIHLTPFARYIMKYTVNPKIFIKDKDSIGKYTYPRTSVSASAECLKLAKLLRKELPKLTVPLLFFKSVEDSFLKKNDRQVIDLVSSDKKELFYLNNSFHDAVLDFDKGIIIDKIFSFIRENTHGDG